MIHFHFLSPPEGLKLARAALVQSFANHFRIEEMVRAVLQNLFAFRAFAGNEDEILWRRPRESLHEWLRAGPSRCARFLRPRRPPLPGGQCFQDPASRIVARHDHVVGKPCGNGAHDGALPGSRSPPQPNTVQSSPRACTPERRLRAPFRARRACGRNQRRRAASLPNKRAACARSALRAPQLPWTISSRG